jgi:FHA domain
MDGFLLVLWIVRFLFLGLLYLFLARVVQARMRDLRAATRDGASELGRLVVVASPPGDPAVGTAFALDAVTTIGRDVNNAIVVDDPFASAEHAVLTFRGRGWYLEDVGSTNGTYLNGEVIDGIAALTFGDELQVGQVRMRLERSRR